MKLAAILATLALVGCANRADDKICATAPNEGASGDMNACIHKWAYRLAQSNDPADVVAKAVVHACNDVANEVAERVGTGPDAKIGADLERAKTEAYRGIVNVGEMQALFRVVQARAGKCDVS